MPGVALRTTKDELSFLALARDDSCALAVLLCCKAAVFRKLLASGATGGRRGRGAEGLALSRKSSGGGLVGTCVTGVTDGALRRRTSVVDRIIVFPQSLRIPFADTREGGAGKTRSAVARKDHE